MCWLRQVQLWGFAAMAAGPIVLAVMAWGAMTLSATPEQAVEGMVRALVAAVALGGGGLAVYVACLWYG